MVVNTTGRPLIPRPRLQALLTAQPVVLIEAPGGYGKSVAWAQLAANLDDTVVRVRLAERVDLPGLLGALAGGCRRAGLPALAGAIEPDDPDGSLADLVARLAAGDRQVLIGIDEVQRASTDAATWLAQLAERLPAGTRLVLAGRRLGPEIANLRETLGASLVGEEALRFRPDEVCAVLAAARGITPTDAEVHAVVTRTGGWPAAVALAAARGVLDGVGTSPDILGTSVLGALVDDVVAAADPATRRAMELAAGLPLLSAAVVALVGGDGALDRMLDAGLPVRFRSDGWGELPDPIRDLLLRQPLPAPVGREVAALYARRGELGEAVGLLHRGDDAEGLVTLLAAQTRPGLLATGLELLHALLDGVPDSILEAHPELLVRLVRASERHDRLRAAWRDRALQILPEGTPARRAVEVEAALDGARAGDLEGAIRQTGLLVEQSAPDEHATLGRAHLVRGLCLLVKDTAANLTVAADAFEQAIGLFDAAGERDWQAEAHQALGFGCQVTAGAFGLGAEHLATALSLRPAPDGARAATLTYLAEALTLQGRLEESAVALREAAAIGRRLGDDRTIAYAAWSSAELACQRRDRVAMGAALDEAEAHPAGWFNQLAGTEFLAHAAEMHALVGDRETAERYLARAMERADGSARPEQPLAAQARLAVTFGEPAEALALVDAWEASPLAVRRDRWLGLLFRAVCQTRLGNAGEAAALLERATLAAAELDDPERLGRREPELLAIASPASAAATPAPQPANVILLGRFAVERNGVDVTPPPGRPSTLIKLLALKGTLTIDAAIDALWDDDVDSETGAARLRNLLHRVRAASGPIVERRDGALALERGASVDAQHFEQEAALALTAPTAERAGLARRALARSTGELLPTDRYDDWADAPRERIRRRQLALLDLVANDALERGDLDEAGRLLDAAIATDPLEEERYVRLAKALVAQGRSGRAGTILDQALAVAADLDVEPGAELRAVLAAVRASS